MACKQIARLLWNREAGCHVHKKAVIELILSQLNPVLILITYFHKISHDIILTIQEAKFLLQSDRNSLLRQQKFRIYKV